MARVTVEDCMEYVPNRFELVILAAERAKNIHSGSPLTLPRHNDKNGVVALREIAAGNVDIARLRESHIAGLCKNNKLDAVEDENLYAENQEIVTSSIDFSSDHDAFSSSTDIDINFTDDVIDDVNVDSFAAQEKRND